MPNNTYSMSFTSGALLFHESLTVTRLYEELGDWEPVRQRVLDDNLLQMRTTTSSKRIYREVAARLKCLTPEQLALLCTGSREEQLHLLWLAVCKRYRFIYDFAVEVLREKFIRLDFALAYEAYDIFFNNKAEWRPEVAGVADSTRKKLRQVLFKMLREANFLTRDDEMLPTVLSPRTLEVIAADAPAYLLAFPIPPAEVQAWLP